MTTYGYSKYVKYYTDGNVNTTVLCKSEKLIKVYSDRDGQGLVDQLIPGHPITVLQGNKNEYHPRLCVTYNESRGYVSIYDVEKPTKVFGATENLNLKTRDLIKLGEQIFYEGTTYRRFDSIKLLNESILVGLKNNTKIYSELLSNIEELLREDGVIWNGMVEDSDINELGKYFGEVYFPYCLLKQPKFVSNQIKSVLFPESNSHGLFDSMLEFSDGSTTLISSKYDQGAKPSFYNFCSLQKGEMKDSVFKQVCDTFHKTANASVYNYWLKYVLNRNESPITGELVRQSIIKSEFTDLSNRVLESVERSLDHPAAIDNFPSSCSNFISYSLARELNNCEQSQKQLKELLTNKKIYVVRLNDTQWLRGKIKFRCINMKDSTIKVIRGNSAWSDIRTTRGVLAFRTNLNEEAAFDVRPGVQEA